jgi:predicted metal-dependent peptidase
VNADEAAGRVQLQRIERGLRMITVPFPHLAGLAAAARVTLDDRLPTIGVFASGRLAANPGFVRALKDNELIFVLAHEMLHLALRTHDRGKGADRLEFNYAHDYIINDILRVELAMPVPANGLDMPGAREKSAEEIVLEMRRDRQAQAKTRVWQGEATSMGRLFGPGGRGAQAGEAGQAEAGDVLGAAKEAELYPEDAAETARRAEQVKEAAAKALGLARAMGLAKGLRGTEAGSESQTVLALRGLYRIPWQLALQRWIESVAPGDRTFTRPSRRQAEQPDVVLPGRRREGWILNVVLDTSGSMTDEIPRALGTLGEFCEAVGVDRVRLVQCDAAVTSDEMLDPQELAERRIEGYGGSDLSAAMHHLAADQHVRAVVVLTDGEIAYPAEPMPYELLWLVPARFRAAFTPPYGRVVSMELR